MDTQSKNLFGGETKMEPLENDNLNFETVFILDNGFEEIQPESISPNFSREFHDHGKFDTPHDGGIESNFEEVIEEGENPSYGYSANEFPEESKVILNFGTHESAAMLDEVHRSESCVWTDFNPFIGTNSNHPSQSNVIINSDTSENSPSLVSSLLDNSPNIVGSFSSSQINKDITLKREIRSLKLKRKEKYLSESLNKIDEIIKNERMKKSMLNTKKKYETGTVKKSSQPKNDEGNKKISELAPNSGQNFFRTSNVLSNDFPRECNIDFLKSCVIEASRALIKTNTSLRTLSKLLHSEIFIEKKEAGKHLKEFQFTFNSFKKRMNDIDNRLLTHYRNFIPDNETKALSESVNKKSIPGSLRNNNSNNDSKDLLNGRKLLEVIIPAASKEQVKRMSSRSFVKYGQNVIHNQKTSLPNDTSIEIESKKRKKSSNRSPSPKKIKTKILHRNWYSERNKVNEIHITSVSSSSPSDASGDPIIVLE